MDRRSFLNSSTVLGGAAIAAPCFSLAQTAPAVITRDAMRPQMAHGTQSGDPKSDGAVIWTRSDRPSRLWLAVSYTHLTLPTNREV